jgi:type VI protein secretion system component VasK
MSTATSYATQAPARPSSRLPLLGRMAAGALLAAALVALAVALWPASEADKARADGEQVGEAVAQLYGAESADEVDAALAELHTAALETGDNAGAAVSAQVADQEDALARAAEGFAGSVTTDSEWDAELYQAELDLALNDLESQASQFRTEGPEVRQAFWEGYEDGLSVE